MTEKITNVVIWKARAIPGDRVIPPHLKMAILSRGRIRVPADKINILIQSAIENGATWPLRLIKPFDQIFSDVAVSVELFQQRKPLMSSNEVVRALRNYLVIRKQKHLPDCYKILFTVKPHSDRKSLERSLNLDFSRIYSKPRVRVRKGQEDRYWLLVYACIPKKLTKFIAQPKPATPPKPPSSPSGFRPLTGILSENVRYNVRSSAAGTILGELVGHRAEVKVLGKTQANNVNWLEIEVIKPVHIKINGRADILPANSTAWITSEAFLVVIAPWDVLIDELKTYESSSTLSLSKRITKIRQLTHVKKLPFDDIIGTKAGKEYKDGRVYDPNAWQFELDYQAVTAPDQKAVDFQHLMVGMDVLGRPEKDVEIYGLDVGKNWGASTWAGDVGAGVADMTLKKDKRWEKKNRNVKPAQRSEYYFGSRAPDWDLRADLDGWQLVQLITKKNSAIWQILDSYYSEGHGLVTGPQPIGRKLAIERFLKHYGFEFDFEQTATKFPALIKQNNPSRRIMMEILQFSEIWIVRRGGKVAGIKAHISSSIKSDKDAMRGHFINFMYWLEYEAIKNEARVVKT